MPNSSITIINPAASTAQMAAATATNVVATPGTVRAHPGVAKAWCRFNGSTTGTNVPISGFNVTSVTRNSTGDYTINFTVNFSDANYGLFTSYGNSSVTSGSISGYSVATQTASSCRVTSTNAAQNAVLDLNSLQCAFFGN